MKVFHRYALCAPPHAFFTIAGSDNGQNAKHEELPQKIATPVMNKKSTLK
jgi:hypothetical protein